jgi:hypothetical protein
VTSAAKAVKRSGLFTARLNPCPSFDSLPHPKVSEGFMCQLANSKSNLDKPVQFQVRIGFEASAGILGCGLVWYSVQKSRRKAR